MEPDSKEDKWVKPREAVVTMDYTSNAGPFRVAIAEMFQDEGQDKQHSSWILDRLREQPEHQYRLDLPTDSDVRKAMGRCIRWKKQARDNDPNYVELMQAVAVAVDDSYSLFIDAELEKDPSLRPSEFMERAVAEFAATRKPLDTAELQGRVKKLFSSRESKLRNTLGITATTGQRGGSGTSNVTFIINDIIENDSKPSEVWAKLCAKYHADDIANGPADFPAKAKAMTFIRNWRTNKSKIKEPENPTQQ